MKFLFRSLIVLAVAVSLGLVLYFAVQALPNDPPRFAPSNARIEPGSDPRPENPEVRPERREGGRNRRFSLRSLIGLAERVILFSVLVFAAVIGKNILFGRKPIGKMTGSE